MTQEMNATVREASTIRVRNPRFDLEDVPRHWLMKSRLASHIANGANLLFPAGERFFIRSVKHFQSSIDDPKLAADVRAFFAQEGRHAAAHEKFFDVMRAQGLSIDTFLKAYELIGYDLIERVSSPKLRLASTAACEHFTAIMAEAALTDGTLEEAHAEMRELLTWHSVEEIEHRAVAFDVLTHVDPSYPLRMMGLAIASTTLSGFWFLGTLSLLLQDRTPDLGAGAIRERRKQQRSVIRTVFLRGIRDYVRRDFHPAARDLSAVVAAALGRIGYEKSAPERVEKAARMA